MRQQTINHQVLMHSRPFGMPSYVIAVSSAHETMHDVEFIRLAVMFAVSLHTASISHQCSAHRNSLLWDLWVNMQLAAPEALS